MQSVQAFPSVFHADGGLLGPSMLRNVGLPDEASFPPAEERDALEDCRTVDQAISIIGDNCRIAEEELRERFPMPWVAVHFAVFFSCGKTRADYTAIIGDQTARAEDVSMAVAAVIDLYEHQQRVAANVA